MPAILIRKEVATRWLSDPLLKTSHSCFPIISVRLGLEGEEGISESQFILITTQFYQIFFIKFLPSLLYNLNTLNSLSFLPILLENKYNLISVFLFFALSLFQHILLLNMAVALLSDRMLSNGKTYYSVNITVQLCICIP